MSIKGVGNDNECTVLRDQKEEIVIKASSFLVDMEKKLEVEEYANVFLCIRRGQLLDYGEDHIS